MNIDTDFSDLGLKYHTSPDVSSPFASSSLESSSSSDDEDIDLISDTDSDDDEYRNYESSRLLRCMSNLI